MDFAIVRNRMVEAQIARRGVCDSRIPAAMQEIPNLVAPVDESHDRRLKRVIRAGDVRILSGVSWD
ncbi:MAG TPA: hypothetical protein VG798_03545 [Rhizomicrobium sp.]|nr:hypothetical protein [Rhizomicrobium sp.]